MVYTPNHSPTHAPTLRKLQLHERTLLNPPIIINLVTNVNPFFYFSRRHDTLALARSSTHQPNPHTSTLSTRPQAVATTTRLHPTVRATTNHHQVNRASTRRRPTIDDTMRHPVLHVCTNRLDTTICQMEVVINEETTVENQCMRRLIKIENPT